jgi:hypothetical protein
LKALSLNHTVFAHKVRQNILLFIKRNEPEWKELVLSRFRQEFVLKTEVFLA